MKTTNTITITNRDKKILFVIMNEQGVILDANAYFNEIFFHKESIVENTNIYDILYGSSKEAFKSAVQKAVTKHNPYASSLVLQNEVLHKQIWRIKKMTIKNKEYFLCAGISAEKQSESFKELNDLKASFAELKLGLLVHADAEEILHINQDAQDLLTQTEEHLKKDKYLNNLWKINKKSKVKTRIKNQTITWSGAENKCSVFNFHSFNFTEKEAGNNFPDLSCFYEINTKQPLSENLNNTIPENIFSDFFSQSGSMKWIVDENDNLIFANKSFLTFFLLNDEVINRNLFEIFPETIAQIFSNGHKYVLDFGDIQNYIQHSRQADGKEYYLMTNLHAIIVNSFTKLIGGEAFDITEITKSKKELSKATERLETMTRSTTDAIWEWNVKTGEIFRNETLHNIIGYHSTETADLSWWHDHIHPDDRERVEQNISYTLSHNEQTWEQEYRFVKKDGEYMEVYDRGFIIYEYGVPYKMIGTIQDLTKIKTLEASLFDEKILKQKDIAETIISVQEKERTNLGHELHDNINQILMTAKLYLGMLHIDEPEKKEIKDKAVDFIMESIEEIRILSKKLVIPQVKDNNLIQSIKTLIADIEFTTKLKINFNYDNEIELMLKNKKVTFFRIVQEQLKNIIKHSKATTVDINFSGLNKPYFQVQIKDNGVGFDTNITRQGIGLSNIYERVKLYEGDVQIISSPGKGCETIVKIQKRKDLIEKE